MTPVALEETSSRCSWACRLRAFTALSLLSAALLTMSRSAETWRLVLLYLLPGLSSGAAAVACLTGLGCLRRGRPPTEDAEVARLREELAALRATMATGGAAPGAVEDDGLAAEGEVAGSAPPPPFGIPGAGAGGAALAPGGGAAAPANAPAGAAA